MRRFVNRRGTIRPLAPNKERLLPPRLERADSYPHLFGSLIERNEMVEVVMHSVIQLSLIGHIIKSICKMWVRISLERVGLPQAQIL